VKQNFVIEDGDVMMSADWWAGMRKGIEAAIADCNDIAAAVEAHQRSGKYDAEELLDLINGWSRNARKHLEIVLPPF